MLSKIKDLDRYKQDQKRFSLAIDSTSGETREEGQKLHSKLIEAVTAFDNVMENLVTDPNSSKLDHSTAQKHVAEAKQALENWVLKHAPNIHIETTK